MKKLKYIVVLSLLMSLGCSDDFVELSPQNSLNSEEFYKTKDDFNAAVIATYAKLQGQVNIYFELVEWRSDNLDLAAPTAGTQDRFNINKFQETPDNGIILSAWENYYNGIFRANVIIEKIGAANFDATLKKQLEAEARFIRALTYFNIVRIWGDAPIVLKTLSVSQALNTGRSPVAEVYVAIETDLKFAAENLPVSQVLGRATSGAAKSLLGKVYLTEKNIPKPFRFSMKWWENIVCCPVLPRFLMLEIKQITKLSFLFVLIKRLWVKDTALGLVFRTYRFHLLHQS